MKGTDYRTLQKRDEFHMDLRSVNYTSTQNSHIPIHLSFFVPTFTLMPSNR